MLKRIVAARWRSRWMVLIGLGALWLGAPVPRAGAMPGFARKHNVKCYNCHLMPPVLNKTGYLYKRFGYRSLPDYDPGTTPRKLSELDRMYKWSLTDAAALMYDPDFTVSKTQEDGARSSQSSFNADAIEVFSGGNLPQTPIAYFVEAEISSEGAELDQAVVAYAGGRVNSSFLLRAGKMLLQEDEGTRGAMGFSLFPSAPLQFEHADALNFTMDHKPVGVHAGYTWASPYFAKIVAFSAKVTNGVDEEGEGIAFDSKKNAKDFWFNADYWFGPDGGVTFMTYYGKKDQEQQFGEEAFTFRPVVTRVGFFGNYLFFDKLDVIGGYVRTRDDWKWAANASTVNLRGNSYRGEVDYYFMPGLAAMARYDWLNQDIQGGARTHSRAWSMGASKALTETGNVIVRGAYTDERGADPVTSVKGRDRRFIADIRFIW
ncbi:MAG: hypothetical protein KIT09_29110 [Bryobacteraceae bacterium]|nr:hypothetical protein [Bryobacteraceae bacterium]